MKRTALFIVVLFFIGGFAINSYGQDEKSVTDHIKPYGNLYMFFGSHYATTYTEGQTKETDHDLVYRINEHSNLGFNFNYAKYKGVFELGIEDIENDRDVKVRKAYGEYNLGWGKLMIGQDWSPYASFSHEMADYYRSKGFGSLYEDPNLQIKLTYLWFYISIMKPYVPVSTFYTDQPINHPTMEGTSIEEYEILTGDREVTSGLPLDNIDSYVPKCALGFELTHDIFRVNAGGAVNVYAIEDTDAVRFNKKWIYSYLGYINADVKKWDFILGFSFGYLVNPANFGIFVQSVGSSTYVGGAATAIENIATGKFEIKDTRNIQFYIELGYQISDKLLAYAGYGYSLMDYPIPGSERDRAMEYYINCKFNIAGLIALTPSFSLRDYMKDMARNKEGKEMYTGILATVSYY